MQHARRIERPRQIEPGERRAAGRRVAIGDHDPGAGVGEHELQARRREPGIEREVGRAGGERAEHGGEHGRAALDEDRDDVAALDAARDQRRRDPIALGRELGVGHAAAGVAQRHAIAVLADRREQRGQRGVVGERSLGLVPRRELRALVAGDLQQLAQRAARIGGDRVGQREEAPAPALGGLGRDDVGVVVEAADQAVDRVDEPQRDVLGRRRLEHALAVVLQVAPARRALAGVLVREERLVDREPALVAPAVEHADQVLERHVLRAERLDHLGADPAHQLEEAGVGIDPQPQRQRVDEEPHDGLELGHHAAAHRRADHDLGLPGELVEQRGPGAEQGHEQGGALAQADRAQRRRGGGRQRQPLGRALAALHRRARVIGRQVERVGGADQPGAPVLDLAGQLGAGEPVAVPGGEVGVRHRGRGTGGRRAGELGGVQRGHVLVEQVERPAVPDDVVRHEEQHVEIGREPEQPDPEQRRAGQIERLGDLDLQPAGELGLALVGGQLRQVVERDRRVDPVDHELRRRVADRADRGAQHGLAPDQLGERAAERRGVERASQAVRRRHVEHGAAELELLQVPHALLHQRQRRRAGVAARRDLRQRGGAAPGAAIAGAVEPGREAGDRGVLEPGAHRHAAAERARQPRGHLRDQQRVAAEREEVVEHAEPRHRQRLLVRGGDDLLGRGPRRDRGALPGERRPRRGGQRLAIDLAAAGERQRGERDEPRGDHVVGQRGREVRPERVVRGRGGRGAGGVAGRGGARHDVADQPHVARAILARDHGGAGDRGVRGERGLDLAELDAVAADLDLEVGAAEALQRAAAVGELAPAAEVAGAVHPRAGLDPRRVGDEPLGGQLGPTEVAERHAVAADVELADHADRAPAGGPRRARGPWCWRSGGRSGSGRRARSGARSTTPWSRSGRTCSTARRCARPARPRDRAAAPRRRTARAAGRRRGRATGRASRSRSACARSRASPAARSRRGAPAGRPARRRRWPRRGSPARSRRRPRAAAAARARRCRTTAW